jgi:hypothetical protein
MTGDYRTHNTTFATRDAVAVVAEPLPYTGRLSVTVPPGETVIHIWRPA